MTGRKKYLGRQYEAAMEDGPKYVQYPDDYHPVAYRVVVTGIYVTDSAFDPDESDGYLEEIVRDMVLASSADMRLVRLTDAKPVTEEQKAEWQAERVRKAKAALKHTEEVRQMRKEQDFEENAKPSAFQSAVDTVTGIYKAQGILDDQQDNGAK